MKIKFKNKGFVMVEVIVAISIIVVSILAAMFVTQKSISVSRQALHTEEAGFLLEEGAEAIRIIRDNSWNNLSSLTPDEPYYITFSGSSWSLSSEPVSLGIFDRTINISNVDRDEATGNISDSGTYDPGTKLITVNVSWYESGVLVNKKLQFYIMDIFSS